MTAPVVLDISRLIGDAGRRTPTGILRVELAYARYLIATRPDHVLFTARSILGRIALVGRRQALRLFAETSRLWADESPLRQPTLALRCFSVWVHWTLFWRGEWLLYSRLRRRGQPAIYIVVSHANLDRPAAVRRLKKRLGARMIFFIHDLIPLQFPEFETPGWDKRCERRLCAAAELADAVLVNSHHTRDELLKEVGLGRPFPPVVPVPLGVAAPHATMPSSPASGDRYFVILGTIEPKKNHLLLLNVWRQLREIMADETPRLIVVGRRGWENENVIDMLERSRALTGFVEERGTVSDRELAPLLAGARALLLPSFAEGYGLPLVEALAAGLPVICSDISAFREMGGDVPEFIDPLDGPSWRQAIIDYTPRVSPRRQAQLNRLKNWVAPTWDTHFQAVERVIETLRHQNAPQPAT